MTRRRRWTAVLISIAVLGALALGAAATLFRLEGGRWFVVTTPSMGQALPVGSLILTTPTTTADVAAGDLITFRNPASGTVYTHRAVARSASTDVTVADEARTWRTRGDINAAADPWSVRDQDLIGAVTWNAPGVGWLVRGLPVFFGGLALIWALTSRLSATRRYSLRLVGLSSSLALTTFWLKPWIGLERLNQRTPDAGPGVLIDVVSTGLLPIRATEVDGDASVSLVNGEVATLHLAANAKTGAIDILTAPDLGPGGWVAVIVFCLLPTLWCLLVGLAPDDSGDGSNGEDPEISEGSAQPNRGAEQAAASGR